MGLFRPTATDDTATFYEDLMEGRRSCFFWGRQRFDAAKAARSRSVAQHFTTPIRALIRQDQHVLDVGCGAGVFLPIVSPLCARLIGLESSPAFAQLSRDVVQQRQLTNTSVVSGVCEALPFDTATFDVVLVVDVLHHLTHLRESVAELQRVLKPGGTLIVFEPSKLNPLLALLCFLDRNEWGLLALGTPRAYRRLLGPHFTIETLAYSGLVIGPDNRLITGIADLLSAGTAYRLLGWLNPKLRIVARKPAA